MKRTLLIIGIIILVGLGLYLGRSYIFKSATPVEVVAPTNDLPVTPIVNEMTTDVLTAVADLEVFDYWIDVSDRSVYAVTADGIMYRIPAGGAPEKLFSAGSKNVSDIKPAPRGASVLIEGGGAQNPFFSVLNAAERSNKFLPLGATSAAWSPDGKEIAFLKNQTLNIFTVASGKSRLLSGLNMTDVLLEWKKPKEIYIGSRPAAGILGRWWTYSLDKKTLRPLTEELPGLTVRWSNDGQYALEFSNQADSQGNNLTLLKNNAPSIGLRVISLPEKCAQTAALIYCGELSGADAKLLPDAYYQHQFGGDNIARIDTADFASKKIIFFGENAKQTLDVYHPTVVGPFLYFLNRSDNKIYSLVL